MTTSSKEHSRTAATPVPGGPRRLSAQECWSQLRQHHEGRLGYLSGRGPRHVVLPYVVRDNELVLRVPAYNEVAQYVGGRRVTFDVIRRTADHAAERIEVAGCAQVAVPEGSVLDALPDEHWPSDLPSRLVRVQVDDVHGERELVDSEVR